MSRFIDEFIFSSKGYAGSFFWCRDDVTTGSWRVLPILLAPDFIPYDSHLVTLLTSRRLVAGWTGTFFGIVTSS